ncbi:hypothetical protein [Micromonospora sp. NPDC048063]|uniref:hypothetical protein n=1 Tax=Micromonospora sp. NPDC048063 TaxID=3364256 RepID=UPI0037124E30
MTGRDDLTDEQWDLIGPLLPSSGKGGQWRDHRQVVDGILCAVITPKPKPRKAQKSLPTSVIAAHDAARKRHSSQRIRVEHVIGHLKNWRILARYHGRREHFDASIRAIAGLLSDHQHTDRTEHTTKRPKALPATAHHR